MSFFSVFKQGQTYLNTWPQEAKLGMIFPENRVMKATRFAQKTMPIIAVFCCVATALCQIGFNGVFACNNDGIFGLVDSLARALLVR